MGGALNSAVYRALFSADCSPKSVVLSLWVYWLLPF